MYISRPYRSKFCYDMLVHIYVSVGYNTWFSFLWVMLRPERWRIIFKYCSHAFFVYTRQGTAGIHTILNMRYIGSKTKLLPAIQKILEDKVSTQHGLTFCDLFAGTSTVGDYFKDRYRIIANDSLFAAYTLSRGKLCQPCSFQELGFNPFEYFNSADTDDYTIGFCYNNFAPTVSNRYISVS